ncbi:F-box protein At5g52880 [Euphorbia lathyris]|uniref:F-box protein At5g52880 n=1 Tax=Euphorbia lathyris TaxID=212925 RepID=UPI003313CFD1
MSNPIERRYEKLAFMDALSRIHHYPTACKDLSCVLRESYNKLPKNLQSIVFQDTLAAFRLLPQQQTRIAVSAAHLLIQSAEAVLPKQRKNMAVKEFKHAMVAHKRRCKSRHQEEGATDEIPQDILVHIFSFLDLQSLVSVGKVCWSWNFAATDNQLWQSQFATFFGRKGENEVSTHLQDKMAIGIGVDWKEAFQSTYKGKSWKKLTSSRGYCGQCETIVWLDNMKCCNRDHIQQSETQQIVPVSSHQVVDYLLNGSSSIISSSDNESESDEEFTPRLWAYPRHIVSKLINTSI